MRIKSVLIANRGEIACRIAQTCRKLGIRTVGVYSIIDYNCRHVHSVDEAHCIGLPDAADSYLNHNKIITLAKEKSVDAIHPGYGFLSEDYIFAQSVIDAGLIFIGPTPEVIRLVGDKIEAKKIATELSIPTIPGITLESDGDEVNQIKKFGESVHYPLLLKSAGGGGGRGMKRIDDHTNVEETLQSAQRESMKFFGNPTVFIEKLLTNVKHIEVQIFGDSSGRVLHLGTRECTYQRNNQKVIEEAPASNISMEIRDKIEEAAVRIGKRVDYLNAGTVEFLVSENNFYFIEVNSRLQVEHPVTEYVYDLDLVELQLKIASGEELMLEPFAFGHALECRICAEVPRESFRVSTGRINALHLPFNRVDHCLQLGTICSHYYDSLIAKTITHRSTREEAVQDAVESLSETFIGGVENNIEFLQLLLSRREFNEGSYNTKLIDDLCFQSTEPSKKTVFIAHLVYLLSSDASDKSQQEKTSVQEIRFGDFSVQSTCTIRDGRNEFLDGDRFKWHVLKHFYDEEGCYHCFELDGYSESFTVFYRVIENQGWITTPEGSFYIQYGAFNQRHSKSDVSASGTAISTLPGKIVVVHAKNGQKVSKGETILVLESMKIEHIISAPIDGVITDLTVNPGTMIDKGVVLFKVI